MLIVARKMRGDAEREVGAIRTVESSRSSDRTITPYLAPRCSLPRTPRGARSRWISPRTQLVHLHEYPATLRDIGWVAADLQRLSTHLLSPSHPDGIHQRLPDCLRHG